jgi:2-amino-4-hydroxy-6-hydroxymethyldihydropteridine diphosphokinase
MTHALIGLGSNLGDRTAQLDEAIQRICGNPQVRCLRRSRYHQTAAVGGPDGQQAFLNAALLVDTTLQPAELLQWTQKVERDMGRERLVRWGPRRIDLDILLWGTEEIRSPPLEVPHPRMTYRPFVLLPAAEIAPGMKHAASGWTIAELVRHLRESPRMLAVFGLPASVAAASARRAAECCGAELVSDPSDPAIMRAPAARRSDWMQSKIESLRIRCRKLERAATDAHTPVFVISDFWVSESLALARCCLKQAELEVFSERFAAATRSLPVPRLRVLVVADDQTPTDAAPAIGAELAEPDVGSFETYRQNLWQIARAPMQGPLLELTGVDSEAAAIEIAAAVDAMNDM